MPIQFQLFKTRRFLPLFITQFFGAFNDNAFKNALLIWFTYTAAAQSQINAPMMVTLAAGIFILPFFLFSVTAGQLADKFEKTYLVKKIKLIEIILMIGSALGFYLHSISLLLIIVFLMGAHSTFFGPIKYSLLPEHLQPHELISANGFIEGGTFLAILCGTIFAGLVIMTAYGVMLLSVAVIVFAVVGWLSSWFIPTSIIADPGLRVGKNIFSETTKIIQDSKKQNKVWLAIVGISWLWFIGSMFLMQFPIYVKEIIDGNAHIVTFFLTLFSVGITIGSVLCNKLLKGEVSGRLVPFSAIGISATIFIFATASYLYFHHDTGYLVRSGHLIGIADFLRLGIYSWMIVLSLVMLSIFSGIFVVPLYAIVQKRSHQKNLSRVIAGNNVMNALFMVGASVISMIFFALHFSVIDILLFVGVLNIVIYGCIRKIVNSD